MIRHIVMIKIQPNENQEITSKKAQKIKCELEKLPKLISEIKFYQVGLNIREIAFKNINLMRCILVY